MGCPSASVSSVPQCPVGGFREMTKLYPLCFTPKEICLSEVFLPLIFSISFSKDFRGSTLAFLLPLKGALSLLPNFLFQKFCFVSEGLCNLVRQEAIFTDSKIAQLGLTENLPRKGTKRKKSNAFIGVNLFD